MKTCTFSYKRIEFPLLSDISANKAIHLLSSCCPLARRNLAIDHQPDRFKGPVPPGHPLSNLMAFLGQFHQIIFRFIYDKYSTLKGINLLINAITLME